MRRKVEGFSLVEVLVATTISMLMFLAVFSVYSLGTSLKRSSQSDAKIQANVRLAMDRLERDTRMIGFRVPSGPQIGGTAIWTPAVFHASATELGFRAEIDGGNAEIVCTPDASNGNCPRNRLRLDSLDYYNSLNCASPDGSGNSLQLIASLDGAAWEPLTCSGLDTPNVAIKTSNVSDATFTAGLSEALTIEQVYYRYVAAAQPPNYGYVTRYVRYANAPNNSFPPTPVNWQVVADHLTDFWLQYEDDAGNVLAGNPLSAAQRGAIRKILIFMEGYDISTLDNNPRVIRTRSEVLVRN